MFFLHIIWDFNQSTGYVLQTKLLVLTCIGQEHAHGRYAAASSHIPHRGEFQTRQQLRAERREDCDETCNKILLDKFKFKNSLGEIGWHEEIFGQPQLLRAKIIQNHVEKRGTVPLGTIEVPAARPFQSLHNHLAGRRPTAQ